MSKRLPSFPIETRNRLCVQTFNPASSPTEAGRFGEPRAATLNDLVAAICELDLADKERLAEAIGLGRNDDARIARLAKTEWVFDALDDAKLAIDRYRKFREEYPRSHNVPTEQPPTNEMEF